MSRRITAQGARKSRIMEEMEIIGARNVKRSNPEGGEGGEEVFEKREVNYRRTLKNPSVARARRYRWAASP